MNPADLAILAVLAGAMAASTAVFVRWAAECRSGLRAAVVVFLLLMMTGMLGGALLYEMAPSRESAVAGLWFASAVMSASVALVFVAFVRTARATLAGEVPAAAYRATPGFVATVVGLVLLNEFLMGWTFGASAGGVPRLPTLGLAGAAGFLGAVVDSPWFLFTMAAEMLLTGVLLRDRLPRPVLAILLVQSAIMALSPPALSSGAWVSLAVYASSALMIGLFVYLMEYLYRHHQLSVGLSTYLLELLGVYAMMMAGLFVWLYYGDALGFAASVVLEMVVFYVAVVRPEWFSGASARPWQLRAHWAFALLSFVFVAELFMGAVLDVRIEPATYLGTLPLAALSGPPSAVLLAALENGFWFLATITASTWFLLMMGAEMGALVVFKLRETRNRENQVRLLLMLGSYAAFAVFYPSLYFALWLPNAPPPSTVPVLGWSMGVGSYPLAVGVFGAILLTYVVTGALTVLFGRRVICSVFCTAPLMYQGTTIDSMKAFNRTSTPARKYLSSRLSAAYSVTTGAVMVALVGTSFLSYLDSVGRAHLYVLGTDPSVFLFTLSFSVVWYVLFVSIPYAGNYNCVTMGWCYTGTIAQAFQKAGMFKLKVRDKEVCRACTTLDCAKGCPVGLVDMPGHFRRTGEFRSSKCCGVGDCIEACPHDNMYISDVRHWVRRRLGLPETRARRVGPGPTLARPGSAGAALGAAHQVPALAPGALLLPMAGEPRGLPPTPAPS
jgi:polyferredoxin